MMQERSDRTSWLALLLLIPSAGLALPGLLGADPLPHAAGTGWALLFLLPAACLLPFCLGRGLPKSALLFLPHLALLALAADSSTDTFELQRAAILLALSIASFLAGSALSARAMLLFQRGAILVSLGFTLQALFATVSDGSTGAVGPLGNTGALSQVALPGAVLGAVFALRGPLLFRGLGALAALAFGVHAGTTPVLTGALAFAIALGAWVVLAPTEARSHRWRALAFAAVAPLCFLLAPVIESPTSTQAAPSEAVDSTATDSDLGGVEVRLRIWNRSLRMAFDHALTGVGPGQFRASFPPYRDPKEIELSTYQHHSEVGGEVEHAHSDWVQAFAEFGVIGGLAFCALLVLVARSALRACRQSGEEFGPHSALGPVCLALLINSTQHAPLSFEPAPLVLAWVLFGASLQSTRTTSSRGAVWIGLCVAAALFLSLTTALRLVSHGEHLAKRQLAAARYGDKLLSSSADSRIFSSEFWLEEGRLLRDALEAAPDSTTALSLQAARYATWTNTASSRSDARKAWERVLVHRPHQVSALIGLGLLAEDDDSRRALWNRAIELDPGHPTTLENLARLESLHGSPERAFEYIDRLRTAGHLDDELLSDLGARVLLAGRTRIGTELLSNLYPEFDLNRPEDWFALSEAESQRGGRSLLSDGLKATAHRLWGLENLASGEFGFAQSKLRQALKLSRIYLPNGDLPTRLLLIASYEISGDTARARLELEELERESILPEDWHELPESVTNALQRLGLQAPARTGL